MSAIRIAGHPGFDESAPHDRGNPVDQRVLNNAVRDVNHAVGAEFEQTELGRAQPAADCEPRTQSKSRSRPGNHRYLRQAMGAREALERAACRSGDARLAESRTSRTWRPMRAGRQLVQYCLLQDQSFIMEFAIAPLAAAIALGLHQPAPSGSGGNRRVRARQQYRLPTMA